ncbi:hypothetical protein HDZ31DRAFT_49109, partial [Schizophyllum fasciatum]
LLVYVTQRLAMRHSMTARESLTAIHDEHASWSGAGSAIMCLWNQFSRRSALKCVLSQVSMDKQAILGAASSFLPYLALQSPESTIGLVNATIYDRLPPNNGALTTTVNATTFDVTCGALESLKILSNSTDSHSGEVTSYDVSHVYRNGTEQKGIELAYLVQNNTMVFTQHDFSPSRRYNAENRSFYIYGTFDIQDSKGMRLPHLWLPQRFNQSRTVSMIGCNLYAQNHTVEVNAITRMPLPGRVPTLRNTSSWYSWVPQPIASSRTLDIRDLWTTAFRDQYTTSLSLSGTAASSMKSGPYLGFMESFAMAILNLKESDSEGTIGSVPRIRSRARVQLHDVENALGRLAAAYFWSLSQIDAHNQYGIERTATVTIAVPEIVPQLQLNRTPIFIGLIVYVVLAVTSVQLVLPRSGEAGNGKIPTSLAPGLLQFLWLAHKYMGESLDRIVREKDPSEDNLRRKGLKEVPSGGDRHPDTDGSNTMKVDATSGPYPSSGGGAQGSPQSSTTTVASLPRGAVPKQIAYTTSREHDRAERGSIRTRNPAHRAFDLTYLLYFRGLRRRYLPAVEYNSQTCTHRMRLSS